ncbi:MAG: YfhO family protein [Alistipes sp.]|jgi:hypothetical protein|nr:YfhO family protein [Alistipes sp.]
MKKAILKALPYLAAVVVFWLVSALYFSPQFGGNTLPMGDVTMYGGMKADISAHRAATGEDPQWTGGMFGGMPAYLITVQYPAMILRDGAQWMLSLMGEPAALMFLAMVGFWIMLLLCGVNLWVAIPFALAYGLSTYNILIIEAGHITKMRAMGYAPMLVGAIVYTFRHRMWLGGALSALFGALLIAASHHQITWYFLLVVAAFWINEFVVTARTKSIWRQFCIRTAVLAGAAVLAVGANFTHLWYTLEHSPETTRGGSEVLRATTADSGGESTATGGLDLDYATAWSYGTGESLNMLIPNFRGGSSSGGFGPYGPVARVLHSAGYLPQEAADVAATLPGYWGTQPGTGGPTYLGAVMVFLFVLGMFVLPGCQKWWILGVSVVALLLAWGRNAMWFTELSFVILPGYNKFRTVAMALAVLQWSAPFVAALVAAGLWKGEFTDRRRFNRGLVWSLGLTGGVSLLFALVGGSVFDFAAATDQYYESVPGLLEAFRTERASMLTADSWRSLLFVALTAGVVWLWAGRKNSVHNDAKSLKIKWLSVGALAVLTLADMIPVDVRFLSRYDFVPPSGAVIKPDEADREIMADPELGFRVFNTDNPFNEALTSYFHRSVGGYHAAKLRRYQDVIDRYLSRYHPGVLGMLNTKYFIVSDPASGERMVELNGEALGAAWFVDGLTWVDGATAELEALDKTNLRRRAVVDLIFSEKTGVPTDNLSASDNFSINLTEYRPNYLKYETSTSAEGVAVFSEIYYDKGWMAYIDGEPTDYFRSDYILRAMVVPAGQHVIEWRFRAPHFAAVEGVTVTCSLMILLWLAFSVLIRYIKAAK